jgi:hypothetical protein
MTLTAVFGGLVRARPIEVARGTGHPSGWASRLLGLAPSCHACVTLRRYTVAFPHAVTTYDVTYFPQLSRETGITLRNFVRLVDFPIASARRI